MNKYLFYIFFSIFIGCQETISNCSLIENKEIVLYNKLENFYTKRSVIEITDTIKLKKMCKVIFSNNKKVNIPDVRDNLGYIDVFFKDGNKYFAFIETISNGTIIIFNGEYYKNDSLANMVKGLFIEN